MQTLRRLADEALANQNGNAVDKFDLYVDDFCSNYVNVVPQRKTFVKALYQIEDQTMFQTQCQNQLESQPLLNTWFDPIDPLSSITQKEICDLHFALFQSLRAKKRTSIAEYTTFSYLASIDLFLNAMEQEDYENCVVSEVVTHPENWVTDYTTSHAAFQNWEPSKMINVMADAGQAVTSQCADYVTC